MGWSCRKWIPYWDSYAVGVGCDEIRGPKATDLFSLRGV